MPDPDKAVAIDTEFNNRKVPFIITSCENDKGYMGNEGKWFIHLRGTMHIYSDSELDEGYLWRWWRVNGV